MTTTATVLIVDDDRHIRESLREMLEHAGHRALEAGDGRTALTMLEEQGPDLMLLDLDLPRLPGMEVLRRCAEQRPGLPVVIISGKGTIPLAMEATRIGVYDFLEKPVDAQRTLLTVRNALEKAALIRQRDRLLAEVRERYRMVGSSPAMQRVYDLIDKAAATRAKVLITGASGTGKEMVARAIHHNSERAAAPFVTVNCAAIPETLIESELFGHEKHAFTGANRAHKGTFEQATRGTLFLDEIGDMSLMTQAKVLRALQEGRIRRIGGETSIEVDVRVIAATNKDLAAEIEEGNFREDLYYRLNVITIDLPPLGERRADIPDLLRFFLDQFSRENDLEAPELSPGALRVLVGHAWSGNVRELRNAAERLVVLGEGEVISARQAERALRHRGPSGPTVESENLRQAREQFEREHIQRTLIAHGWAVQETADALGIDRAHLWRKMKRYGLEAPS